MTAADAPKLSDFGLSILVEQGDQSGVIRGTPHVHEPGADPGRAGWTYRSDLYSLGVMIYESATGAAPFTGTSVVDHGAALPRRSPSRPRARNPRVSEELEALILSLLAKRPDDRPAIGIGGGRGAARGDRADPSGTAGRAGVPRE